MFLKIDLKIFINKFTQVAKLVDAPGLGSGEFFMQVRVLFCVMSLIISFSIQSFMKMTHKLTGLPYGTVLKYPKSPMRLLLKLSAKQKNIYKQKNRIFSLELGRSLPKRVVWQVSVPFFKNHTVLQKTVKSCSWSVFRSAFFGKMWLLNNASVVPGIVWPTKSQKSLIAKMKAMKALRLSIGSLKTGKFIKHLQKVYSHSFSKARNSSFWDMASSLECLKGSFFVKHGFFQTSACVKNMLRYNQKTSPGFPIGNSNTFVYPGDFNTFPEKSDFFAQTFSTGPLMQKNSVCANQPFLWLSNSFYNPYGALPKKKLSNRFKKKLV